MTAMPTNAQWIAAFQPLTVSGVARYYDYPPESVDLADGPVAFPVLPGAERGTPVSTCIDQSKARHTTYVIIVDAVSHGDNAQNYAKLAALMDALETALDGMTIANYIDYRITTRGDYMLGGAAHWAVIADVTARDTVGV